VKEPLTGRYGRWPPFFGYNIDLDQSGEAADKTPQGHCPMAALGPIGAVLAMDRLPLAHT